MNYIIRPLKQSEIYILSDFLYEAIFQKDNTSPLPKEIINKPELNIFIKDFGKPDDYCLVAEIDNKIIGAVWSRILSGEIKGYGNIDSTTSELAISIYKQYRNKGIGTELMKGILKLLKEKGYKRVSLSVQKDNYAVKMYKAVGFKTFKETEEEYIMVCSLNYL